MKRSWILACCVLALISLAMPGCRGERVGEAFDETSSDGRWRIDGTLIRSYNVTLKQAYDSIHKLTRNKGWVIRSSTSDDYKADITVKTQELVVIDFTIWAPENKATDIGIHYAGGDKIGATRTFDQLEKLLPGKRIVVNKP